MTNMKLQEFITTALCEIINGVEEAKNITSSTNSLISPDVKLPGNGASGDILVATADGGSASLVTFDVAITIEKGKGTSANIGVIGSILKLGAEGHSSYSDAFASRLRFSIPVVLP